MCTQCIASTVTFSLSCSPCSPWLYANALTDNPKALPGRAEPDDIDAAAGAATSDEEDNLVPETTKLKDDQQGAAGMGAAIDVSDQNDGMPAPRAQEGHQGGGHLAWLASEVIRFTQHGAK